MYNVRQFTASTTNLDIYIHKTINEICYNYTDYYQSNNMEMTKLFSFGSAYILKSN